MNMNNMNMMNNMNQMNQMKMGQMNMNMMNNMNNQMNMMNNMNMNMINSMNMMNNNMINNKMNQMNMMNNMNQMNMMKQQMNMYQQQIINQMNNMFMMNQMNQAAQNTMTLNRLKKEFMLCSHDEELKGLGCQFMMENNNCFCWRVTLKGPENTPYEGGVFTIRIAFPPNYPKSGPEFRFLNQIYHLNVDFTDQTQLGHICLNFLNEWKTTGRVVEKPCYGVKQALIDIFCLFYNQNIGSAYNKDMALEYQTNKAQFNAKAKNYTQQYAQCAVFC